MREQDKVLLKRVQKLEIDNQTLNESLLDIVKVNKLMAIKLNAMADIVLRLGESALKANESNLNRRNKPASAGSRP